MQTVLPGGGWSAVYVGLGVDPPTLVVEVAFWLVDPEWPTKAKGYVWAVQEFVEAREFEWGTFIQFYGPRELGVVFPDGGVRGDPLT